MKLRHWVFHNQLQIGPSTWVLAAALFVFLAPAAQADTAAAETTDRPSPGALEEIVVTAQKRTENLQKVPISITALTAERLEASGVTDTMQLPQATPGLVVLDTAAVFLPFIRGIGSTSSQDGFDSSVAVYVDGIYVADKASSLFELNNIERIEVLKGPQGTLFGRNATGGAISIVTKDPGDTAEATGEIGYGRFNEYTAKAYASTPVSSTLGFNMSVAVRENDGYIRDIYRDVNEGAVDKQAMMAKLKWNPTDRFEGTLSGSYSDDNDNASGAYHVLPGTTTTAQAAGYPSATCNYCTSSSFSPDYEVKGAASTLRLAYSLDTMQLVSLGGYREAHSISNLDTDGAEASLSWAAAHHTGTEYSEELQLLSKNTDRLQWITGLYYIDERQGYDDGLNGLIVPLSPGIMFPISPEQLLAVKGNLVNFNSKITTKSEAAFMQGTYSFTEADKLTAGFRYTWETKSADGIEQLIAGVPAGPGAAYAYIPLSSFGPDGVSTTFKRPTWRVAYDHDFSQDIMGYLTYSRGFKSGSYNNTDVIPTAKPVNPESLDAYEVGVKSEMLDHKLRANASAYYYNYSNIQVQILTGATAETQNAASASLYGLDFDTQFVATDQLSLNAGLSLIHSRYDNFQNASVYVPLATGGAALQSLNASGDSLVLAPKATITFGVNYEIPLSDGRFVLNSTAYYNSGYDLTPGGIDTHVGDYTDVAASGTWRSPGDRFFARLWGKNLANERHPINIQTGTNGFFPALAEPVTYGFTVGLKFSP
jgi:iron complex outermembrane receptor protein